MKRSAFFLFTWMAAAPGASAQFLSFGAKGGVPLLGATEHNDESRRYIVGPFIEARLPASFAIEADALYQRIGNTSGFSLLGTNLIKPDPASTVTITTAYTTRLRGNAWEFPVLGKYYFHASAAGLQPFVATGFAFRTVGLENASTYMTIGPSGVQNTSSFKGGYRSDLGVGAAAAAGLRLRVGKLALSPELRYIRWGQSNSVIRKDEAQFLLGLSF